MVRYDTRFEKCAAAFYLHSFGYDGFRSAIDHFGNDDRQRGCDRGQADRPR